MWTRLIFVFIVALYSFAGGTTTCMQQNQLQDIATVTQNWTSSAISNCDEAITTGVLTVVQQVPVAIRIPVPGEKAYSDFFLQNNTARKLCFSCARAYLDNLTGTLARLYIAHRVLLI
jgi:hypothetical protein